MDFKKFIRDRIIVSDGAISTMIRRRCIPENIIPGNYAAGYDYLNITSPDIIYEIHAEFIEAGAGIIRTNTLNACSIPGYNVYEIAKAGACIARKAADNSSEEVLAAGCIGPVSNDSTCDALLKGLIDGGADILMLQSAFRAADIIRILESVKKTGTNLPVIVSISVNDKNGSTISGETVESIYNAIKDYPLSAFGLNGYLSAEDMLELLANISRACTVPTICIPNTGIINEKGEYDESPWHHASVICRMAEKGLVNIAGGDCGAAPEYICAISTAIFDIAPRAYTESLKDNPTAVPSIETVNTIKDEADNPEKSENIPANPEDYFRTLWTRYKTGEISLPNLEKSVIAASGHYSIESPDNKQDNSSNIVVSFTPSGEYFDFSSKIIAPLLETAGLRFINLGILSDRKIFLDNIIKNRNRIIVVSGNSDEYYLRIADICKELSSLRCRQPLMIVSKNISALHAAIGLKQIYKNIFYCADPFSCSVLCKKYISNRHRLLRREKERHSKIKRAYYNLHRGEQDRQTSGKIMRTNEAREYLSRFI